jgi:hypothetical protein
MSTTQTRCIRPTGPRARTAAAVRRCLRAALGQQHRFRYGSDADAGATARHQPQSLLIFHMRQAKIIKTILYAAVIFLISSCASLTTVKTPRQLLGDLKTIADSRDLTNTVEVGKSFGIEFASRAEPVHALDTGALEGFGIDVSPKGKSLPFYADSFQYGMFRDVSGQIIRALISVEIDHMKICATEQDFKNLFARAQKYTNPHILYHEYVYSDESNGSVHSTFDFNENTKCLFRVTFYQNREK